MYHRLHDSGMVLGIRQVGESGGKVSKWNIHRCSFDVVATALRGSITRLACNVLLPVFLSGVFSVVLQLMPFDYDLLYQGILTMQQYSG